MTAYPTKVEPSSRYMGDTEREHACRLLSCYSVRSLLFASYYGFSVDEVDASPLPATHARTIPVESKERPLMWRNADALASDASAKKGTWIRSKDDSATVVNHIFTFLPSKERMPSTACCCQRIDLALHQIVYHNLHQNDIYNAGNTAKTCHSKSQLASSTHDLLFLPQCPLDIALRVLLRSIRTFVVLLLTFAEAQQQLGVAVADIDFKRNDRISLLLGLP